MSISLKRRGEKRKGKREERRGEDKRRDLGKERRREEKRREEGRGRSRAVLFGDNQENL